MNPNVLIITGAFNCAGYIELTVQSVRVQNHSNWTWVIVDDASTDGTGEILDRLASSDQRIRIIHRERNGGRPAVSRNHGIAFALEHQIPFEFLAFIDHDDLWQPEKLGRNLELFAMKPGVGLVYSGHYRTVTDGGEGQCHSLRQIKTPGNLFLFNHIFLSSVMLRRTAIQGLFPLFDEDPLLFAVEDTELWFRLLASGIQFCRTDAEELGYRFIGNSASRTDLGKKLRRIFYLYAKVAMRNPQIPLGQLLFSFVIKAAKFTLEDGFARIRELIPG